MKIASPFIALCMAAATLVSPARAAFEFLVERDGWNVVSQVDGCALFAAGVPLMPHNTISVRADKSGAFKLVFGFWPGAFKPSSDHTLTIEVTAQNLDKKSFDLPASVPELTTSAVSAPVKVHRLHEMANARDILVKASGVEGSLLFDMANFERGFSALEQCAKMLAQED